MPSIRPLSPELEKIAVTELNENPEEILEDIDSIRSIIVGNPLFSKYQLTDQFILSFLRSCKYNTQTIKKKLPYFITMRKVSPELFGERTVNRELLDVIRTGVHLPLPQVLETNSSILHISNYGNLNTKQYPINDGIKLFYMMMEVRFLEDDHTSVAGVTTIEDLSDVTFSHMVTMNIGVLKRILGYVRSGMPYRLKGVHIINAPWFVNSILGLFRDSLPYKMRKRFFIHKKITDLYEYVPQKYLPQEYGGEAGSEEALIKTWEEKIVQYTEYFDNDFQFGLETKISNGQAVREEEELEQEELCTNFETNAEIKD